MTDKEIIAVVTAKMEGKAIETKVKLDEQWFSTPAPVWNFYSYDYRIKPEPHYRPFKNAEEVMEAIKEHGDWVKITTGYCRINNIYSNEFSFGCQCLTYEDALRKNIKFGDGTPFGKLEEE